jgi:prolyl oligopeptidase
VRLALLLILAMVVYRTIPPPPALPPAKPVTTDYFGVKVTDPYRYFENLSSPVVQNFFKQQGAYTATVLDRLGPARQRIRNRVHYLDNIGTGVFDVNRVESDYFFQEIKPGWPDARLFVRPVAGGTPRLLVDPDSFVKKRGEHATIDFTAPSLDGKYVAFGVSANGSENDVTRVVRVSDGKLLREAIPRTRFGVTGWRVDGKSFFYNRLPETAANAPPAERDQRPIVYVHVLGTNFAQDRPVFGIGVNRNVAMVPTDIGEVAETPGSRWVLGVIAHGVRNEVTIYAETIAQLNGHRNAWRKIVDVDDDVTGAAAQGDKLYLQTHHLAQNYKVVAVDLAHPNFARAKVIVPADPHRVVEGIDTARDGVYVQRRDGGTGELLRLRVTRTGKVFPAGTVRLPYNGNVIAATTDPREDGVTFGLTSWTQTLLYYATTSDLTTFDTHLKPPYPIKASDYEAREVKARSLDGTMVPLSIIFHKGIDLDGSHPTYLEGYGAYGVTITPYFDATRLVWLEHRGVYAVCHPRGGGWYGEGWHRAGMISTKQHTVQDFIACAHYLIDHHYANSAHLAGEGTSAGGITIGDAIVQEPKLFAAALDIDGVTDALRSENEPGGPANVPEFGSVKSQAGFLALYQMDAYVHINDGTRYPAVMINAGMDDPRVSPVQMAKFAARLEAASSSGKPVLLRVSYHEGHGMLGASRSQTEDLITDEFSFLLWQLGDPAFASVPKRAAHPKTSSRA